MISKKQLKINLFGVSLGSLINFLASMVFLSLSIDGFQENEGALAYTLILFSFAQVLEAFRFSVTYEIKSNIAINDAKKTSVIFSNGIILSIIFSFIISCVVFYLGLYKIIEIEIILFIAIFLYSANGVFWGIADSKDAVAFTSVAKAISNTIGFIFIYIFSIFNPSKAFYAIIFPPLFFQLFLFIIIKIKLGEKLEFSLKYVNTTNLKLLTSKSIAIFINFFSSTTQGNIERICATTLGGSFLVLMTFFSELSNRLSFLPRMIYGAAYSLLIGKNTLDSKKTRIIGFLAITILIIAAVFFVYISSDFLINLLTSDLSSEPYVKEIFVYFIATAMLKLYSYSGALILNTKGDFKSQPVFTFTFILIAFSYFIINRNDSDLITVIIITSIIAKSSDIIFGLYATFKNLAKD